GAGHPHLSCRAGSTVIPVISRCAGTLARNLHDRRALALPRFLASTLGMTALAGECGCLGQSRPHVLCLPARGAIGYRHCNSSSLRGNRMVPDQPRRQIGVRIEALETRALLSAAPAPRLTRPDVMRTLAAAASQASATQVVAIVD